MSAVLNTDFRDLLESLNSHGVEFMVVGAYALALHGVPRTTGDIDIFVRADPANAKKVFAALIAFGAPLEAAGVQESDFTGTGVVYQIGLPPRRIDILTGLSGVTFDEAWTSHGSAVVDGIAIPFIGRDTLIKNKIATGRPQDLADVDRLR